MNINSHKKNTLYILIIFITCIVFSPSLLSSSQESNKSEHSSDSRDIEKESHDDKDGDEDDDDDNRKDNECKKDKDDDDHDDDRNENNKSSDDDKHHSSDSDHNSKDRSDNKDDNDHNDDDRDENNKSGHDDKHENDNCEPEFERPLGTAQIILDNTAAFSKNALFTNMSTKKTPVCNKSDVLSSNSCNSFSLGNNHIQVIQNDLNGNLTKMIGVNNPDSSSYNNTGTDAQLNYFAPDEHLIKIPKMRDLAEKITAFKPKLESGTFGNITFKEFIKNVSLGRNMYGVVRVEVPLARNENFSPIIKRDQERDSDDDNDDSDSDRKNRNSKFRLCGEKPTAECLLCGPGNNTKIAPGSTVCGISLGDNAKINVFGSLMFDWIDCKTEEPISLTDLGDGGSDISFNIAVPLNINPINQTADNTSMRSIETLANIVGSNQCPTGSSCNLPLTGSFPFDLVNPDEMDKYYEKTKVNLTSSEFDSLSAENKFNLIMPSGYANGWALAFEKLNINAATWQNWVSDTPDKLDTSNVTHILTEADIRKASFQDIPAFMYSGGIVGIHHHANISGLVYIPQAFDLEQNGLVKDNKTFIPSLQYINGAIIVRDGFYFEAQYQGGVTIISNNPGSYDQIKLDPSSTQSGKFKRFPADPLVVKTIEDPINDDLQGVGKSIPAEDPPNSDPRTNPGAQWMEIRPQ